MHRRIIILLFAGLVVSGIFGALIDTWRIFHAPPQEVPGEKFLSLIPAIAGKGEVGFFEYTDTATYLKDLYQAQHIFAPTIVREGTDYNTVIIVEHEKAHTYSR